MQEIISLTDYTLDLNTFVWYIIPMKWRRSNIWYFRPILNMTIGIENNKCTYYYNRIPKGGVLENINIYIYE